MQLAAPTPAHVSTFVRTALHATVWFAHKAGAELKDIERAFAEIVEDVKAEAAAEVAEIKSEL